MLQHCRHYIQFWWEQFGSQYIIYTLDGNKAQLQYTPNLSSIDNCLEARAA